MKIHKNLFETNGEDKIHVDEIAVTPDLLLGETVIVASGSNANGDYTKYGNGRMECEGEVTGTGTGATHIEILGDFPVAFASAPDIKMVAVIKGVIGSAPGMVYESRVMTSTGYRIRITRRDGAAIPAGTTTNAIYMAKGFWK